MREVEVKPNTAWEIKPCPFCGKKELKFQEETLERLMGNDCPCSKVTKVQARCGYCGAAGPFTVADVVYPEEIAAAAIVSWNGRKEVAS